MILVLKQLALFERAHVESWNKFWTADQVMATQVHWMYKAHKSAHGVNTCAHADYSRNIALCTNMEILISQGTNSHIHKYSCTTYKVFMDISEQDHCSGFYP